MAEFQDCLTMQPSSQQGDYKLSYWLKGEDPSLVAAIRQAIREQGLRAQVMLVDHVFLDLLPFAGGRPDAIRHVALQQGIPLEHILVAASQHGDGEVLRGLPLGVVLANHDPSLDELRHQRSVFFARRPQAWESWRGWITIAFFPGESWGEGGFSGANAITGWLHALESTAATSSSPKAGCPHC